MLPFEFPPQVIPQQPQNVRKEQANIDSFLTWNQDVYLFDLFLAFLISLSCYINEFNFSCFRFPPLMPILLHLMFLCSLCSRTNLHKQARYFLTIQMTNIMLRECRKSEIRYLFVFFLDASKGVNWTRVLRRTWIYNMWMCIKMKMSMKKTLSLRILSL